SRRHNATGRARITAIRRNEKPRKSKTDPNGRDLRTNGASSTRKSLRRGRGLHDVAWDLSVRQRYQAGIGHRDLKPENVMVTPGVLPSNAWLPSRPLFVA